MISALEEKLTTNHIPTPEEIITITNGLADSEQRLQALSEQIDQLQGRTQLLLVEKEKLSLGISAYRAMLAPVRRLIPEILQEIFYHCLPTSHNAILSSREAPLVLGRVCRHWRQVSRATPRLWASIHITIPALRYSLPSQADSSAALWSVSSWLARSGALPLSISLFSSLYSVDPSIPTNSYVRPFLDLLSQHSSRWRSIAFRIENFDWNEFFQRFNAEDVPLLEQVHLNGTQVPRAISGDSQSPDFASATRDHGILRAPLLRSVSIPRYASQMLQLPVRWSELIELNLSNGAISLRDVLKALELCPNLVICSISLSDWDSVVVNGESYMSPKVVSPKLEVLSLRDDITHLDMPALLQSLVAPQLRHLSFCRGMNWGAETYPELRPLMRGFEAFLGGLIHPLEELDLDVNSIPHESVMEILKMVPGLKRLSIESIGKPEGSPNTTPSWIDPHSFYFTDESLRRFIPKTVTTVRMDGSDQVLPDPLLEGLESDSDSESATSSLDVPLVGLFNSSATTSESKAVINRLCPDLEVFQCTGAMFSESTFLEFLRARSVKYRELQTARLRRLSVSFVLGRKELASFTEQVLKLANLTGTEVFLNYSKSLIILPARPDSVYSPYQGADEENDSLYPPMHLGFW